MTYDLAVVGGGINGVGIAADAAGRGLSVLLVEMEAREMLVPGKWQAFMKYFEMTAEYRKDPDYFEDHRVSMAQVYQVSEA